MTAPHARTRKRGEHAERGSVCAVDSVNPPGGDLTKAPGVGDSFVTDQG